MLILENVKKFINLIESYGFIRGVFMAWHKFRYPVLEYVPNQHNSKIDDIVNSGWNDKEMIDDKLARWNSFCGNLKTTGPLGFSAECDDINVMNNISFHNINITYAYVLTLAAQNKNEISILDWGGGLGHYYKIGKAVLPNVKIDFHCKEVSLTAEAGKKINPEVHWHTDESCLGRDYDLVMIGSSLQYIPDWKEFLCRIASAVKGYLYLARTPVVSQCPGFLAVQRLYGSKVLNMQFNQTELLDVIKKAGLKLIREFVVGDRRYIKNAPEQSELKSWLFKK